MKSESGFSLAIASQPFTRKEVAAPLMSVAVPLWFWKFREKNSKLWIFFANLKIMENFENLRSIISKVGGKFWRWVGYIARKHVVFSGDKFQGCMFLLVQFGLFGLRWLPTNNHSQCQQLKIKIKERKPSAKHVSGVKKRWLKKVLWFKDPPPPPKVNRKCKEIGLC